MLKSLFGELTPAATQRTREGGGAGDFAATTILESTSGEVNERGQIVDRHVRDLIVTGSPAQAMRAHFATSRDEAQAGGRTIALHDPSGMWAGGVIKALSDASGQPIERLMLRMSQGGDPVATIERTVLVRRMDDTLKVYRADMPWSVQAARERDSVDMALLERADLAAVIIGPMEPAAIEQMLAQLRGATYAHTWRCTRMLFILPVGAQWIASKITGTSWPNSLKVHTLAEPLTSASAVWNALLAHWNRVKPMDESTAALERATGWGEGDFPIKVADLGGTAGLPSRTPAVAPAPTSSPSTGTLLPADRAVTAGARSAPDHHVLANELATLGRVEGLLYVVLVDVQSGQPVATDGAYVADIDRAAHAAAQLMRVHRAALADLGHPGPKELVEEIVLTVGNRYHVLRGLRSHGDFFLLATLDKLRSNLAMVRLKLMDAQQRLG